MGKTAIKTKHIMEETEKDRNILRSLFYKWHKRFSDGVYSLCTLWPDGECGEKVLAVMRPIARDVYNSARTPDPSV